MAALTRPWTYRCAPTLTSKLFRAGWYSVMDKRPQTTATFSVLDTFHLHTLQAKTTAYDFYAVLERLTDTTGLKPPNRYQLAVECPVCPNPQVNLPEGWEDVSPAEQFLYILFIALDACFRLKQRMISSEIMDLGLGTGWAYVTENLPYRHYLLGVIDQKEMRYSTTGVGMGVWARHEFVQPNSVGDLQKGERFANIDYIFGSILRHKDPRLCKIISYDIVCQWWKFLLERMANLPPLALPVVILKMHIHAHTLGCQVKFLLNLVPGSGQTDGEGIECPWASISAITSSTRVSGPGARHDALDDHWNFWNWLKTIGLRKCLASTAILRCHLDATKKEAASRCVAFETFTLQQVD
ncbi:hypothetical protein B0H14DRAFT_3097001 [Mycena olivaceomarginata]|nr:hypothetical protein B0H14DRAFT_3097001 [Mycena olivaceomarginata]